MQVTNGGSATKGRKAKKWILGKQVTDRKEQNYEAYFRIYHDTLKPIWDAKWAAIYNAWQNNPDKKPIVMVSHRNVWLREQWAALADPKIRQYVDENRLYISQLKGTVPDMPGSASCTPEELDRRKKAWYIQG